MVLPRCSFAELAEGRWQGPRSHLMKQLHRVMHWPRRTRVPLRRCLCREGCLTFPQTKVLILFSFAQQRTAHSFDRLFGCSCGHVLRVRLRMARVPGSAGTRRRGRSIGRTLDTRRCSPRCCGLDFHCGARSRCVLFLFFSLALSNARPTRSIESLACGVGWYVWRPVVA